MVYNWLKNNLFQPRYTDCRLCSLPAAASGLCPDCLADLPRNQHACPVCGAGLVNSVTTACGECQRHPPQFNSAHIPYRYAPPLIPFVTGLKFHGRLAEARLLADLFISSLPPNTLPLPECLIPVPLHPQRLRERGYNQALELARPISRHLHLPIELGVVQRHVSTRPQSELSGDTRRRNMRRAFQLETPPPYRHVALIDDVVTTGSTVNELARVLRQAGVEMIQVWAIARA